MANTRAKRIFDLLGASAALVITAPVLAGVAVLVRARLGTPVLYRQERPGLNGQRFVINKFRTMSDARDESGELRSDQERLTKLGRFLRASSLDELPELLNVLMGEMSLVGPRPLLNQYLDLYTPEQARRHEALPGITGLAQISGRNALSWEDKFELDVWYVDNWSLLLDLKILAKTVLKVLQREGVNQPGEATVQYFTGSSGEANE